MDIRELKELLKHSASVVVLDDGRPAFVLLDYQVYRSLAQNQLQSNNQPSVQTVVSPADQSVQESRLSSAEIEAVERLNKEILALKEQIALQETEEASMYEDLSQK